MQHHRLTCPKCHDWRVERRSPGTEYEEVHCQGCGYIAYVGRVRQARAKTREPKPVQAA